MSVLVLRKMFTKHGSCENSFGIVIQVSMEVFSSASHVISPMTCDTRLSGMGTLMLRNHHEWVHNKWMSSMVVLGMI